MDAAPVTSPSSGGSQREQVIPVIEEALEVRRQAVAELRKATTFMALAGETVSLALRFSRVGSRASLMAELASRVLRRG